MARGEAEHDDSGDGGGDGSGDSGDSGDSDGYTEYVTAKAPWLRKIAFLLCQDWHRADDLTQTTIIKLFTHRRRARGTGNLDAYTRTILINTLISEQRTHWWKRVTLFTGRGPGHDGVDAGNVGAALERDLDLGLDLETALAAIAPRQRAVIVLRYYCDLSVEETAAVLMCSPGTVKSQTWHGLAALRRQLTPDPAAL